ncbi:unnamed protein product [Timema podura]|uniref:Uncharacterized protein n=1 Tax=Timema podura TaxID=61482 RepID=A0ABN7NRC1_TIMPD|nr:unnamed protein product [Timema podura]
MPCRDVVKTVIGVERLHTKRSELLLAHLSFDTEQIYVKKHMTSDGRKKVVERYDCSGAGDVDTSIVVQANNDGNIVGVSGRLLKSNKDDTSEIVNFVSRVIRPNSLNNATRLSSVVIQCSSFVLSYTAEDREIKVRISLGYDVTNIPSEWTNPSGQFHIGIVNCYDLYPAKLRERIEKYRKENLWDPGFKKVFADTMRKLQVSARDTII